MLDYFSTLASISAEVLALVMAFFGGYLVYLRQQRDKYREELVRGFQKLDNTIFRWSSLQEYPLDSWPYTTKYLQILQKESWKRSLQNEVLRSVLEKLAEIHTRTRKEEIEMRSQTDGRLVAGRALYLEVKFALDELVSMIYKEFPPPPGDYKLSSPPGEVPFAVKSFVRYDFPNNRESFISWAKRFDMFFKDIFSIYYHNTKPVIDTLKRIDTEASRQMKEQITELEKNSRFSWAVDRLKEYRFYSMTKIKYYEKIFEFLSDMKHKVDEIKDKIRTYDNYFYKGKRKTFFVFLAMVSTGVLIPFTVLFLGTTNLPMETLKLVSSLGFGLSTFLVLLFIFQDISKF